MKKTLATIALLVGLTASAQAADWYWATDLNRADAETVYRSYLLENVSTNAALAADPSVQKFIDGQTHVLNLDGATPAQLDTLAASMSAADIVAAAQVIEYAGNGWSIAVQNNAASNIVALAVVYGVTNQPVPWAAVATAMQAERADATASNDVMRLLNVVGDGTSMLSYKEFYSENGGDVFNVVAP
jgi:hypothetical protein